MRIAIGLISLVGTLLFGCALAFSYLNPAAVEGLARELVKREVEARVGEKLAALEQNPTLQFAARLAEKHAQDIAQLKDGLQQRLQPVIDSVIAEMRDPDCPCRRFVPTAGSEALQGSLTSLLRQGERITEFIRGKYREVAAALLREFRIFTGANALMFALLGATLLLRRRSRLHLLLPAVALLGTTLIVAYLYLFQQDWLHAIVFGDYIGLAYFVHLGLVGAMLGDILLNRGRVCTRIVNLFLQLVGSAATAAPC